MKKLFKWIIAGIGLLSICIAALGFIAYVSLQRSIPAASGSDMLPSLKNNVEVVFDKDAVPHIQAQTYKEAIHTLGYIHARDRLWQMEVIRMAGQGRLSEMFGRATFESDKFLRTLGMHKHAKASFEILKPETKEILEAYSSGVNAFINRETRMFELSLGAEFLILSHSPEPWEAWHSGLALKVMALTLGGNMSKEIQRLALASKRMTSLEIDDLVTYGPRDNPARLPNLSKLYGYAEFIQKTSSVEPASLHNNQTELWPTGMTASNNWVVAGSNTATGKPILANDPHLGLTAPSTMYLAHLSFEISGERRNVIGGTLPGTPFVIAGRTDTSAWGLTTTGLDSQDLYLERIQNNDADLYLTDAGWKKLIVEEETIKFSDGSEEIIKKRISRHGPVLPDTYKNIKSILPDRHIAALKWNALTDRDTTMDGLIAFNLSRDVGDLYQASRSIVSPMQSIVVADVSGKIGLIAPGKIPVRKPENDLQGRAPAPGWMPEYEWERFASYDELPRIEKPASGWIATANANFLPDGFTTHITYDWAEHFRQQRVEELLASANEKHTIAKSAAMQADTFSPAMQEFRDEAFRLIPVGIGTSSAMSNALRQWNGNMDATRPEPLIMLAWFRHLHKEIFSDELRDEYKLFNRGRLTRVLRVLEGFSARNWCDRINTPVKENCAELLTRSLQTAIKELEGAQGKDWRKWQYGKAHLAHSEHRPFSKVGVLSNFFTIEVPSAGGPYTLLRGQTNFGFDDAYKSRHASAYRGIYDLSDMNNSIFIQSTGQSGNFMSDNYRDFAERWSKVEYIPMTTDAASYSQAAQGTWVFKPVNATE